jgi:endo-1,4-beta-mannosidase
MIKHIITIFLPRCITLLSLIFMASCGKAIPTQTPTPTPTPVPQLPPVKMSPTGFEVNGEPFQFIGANSIYFGFYKEFGFSIEDAIRTARENGISVMRIYVLFGSSPWGGRPLEEYDRVLDIAAKNGMYVIVTLADCCQWRKGERPTQCDFTSAEGIAYYKADIERILHRQNTVNGKVYLNDTTILAWDIANEPQLFYFSNSEIHSWVSEIVSYVKELDPDHLVTMGINAGFDLYDTDGPHYSTLDVTSLDFFSFHYYGPNLGSKGVTCKPEEGLRLLKFRTETFASLGKPVVLEEFGGGSQAQVENALGRDMNESELNCWLKSFKDEMDTAFTAGASGVLFWGWGVPEEKTVSLWWKDEGHDVTEEEFCTLIKGYQPSIKKQP